MPAGGGAGLGEGERIVMGRAPRCTTSQRSAVLDALSTTGEFVTAQDLHTALHDAGSPVGLATVYRTLADMATGGEVDTLRGPSGEMLYRQCGAAQHHHHLVCRECGHTVEITAPGVERWARTVAEKYGFSEVGHEVELSGLCADCGRPDSALPARGTVEG